MSDKRYGEDEEKRYFESVRRNEHITALEEKLAKAKEALKKIEIMGFIKQSQEQPIYYRHPYSEIAKACLEELE